MVAPAALAALRMALEIERARARQATTPSPPPEGPPESSFRALGEGGPSNAAPMPEPAWSPTPEREPRDTLPSPIPPSLSKEFARAAATKASPKTIPPERDATFDPLLAVIEALHTLRRSDDVVEGAALILRTALDAIPSAAGLVHVSDVGARDFVTVAAAGDRNADMIGTRTPEGDPLLLLCLKEMQAITIEAAGSTALTGTRFRMLHPERAVLCAPVQLDGQDFGAIELIDPTGRARFSDRDRHAMTYVGERFAEFLADRSIVF